MTVELAIKSLKEARSALIDAKNGIVERSVLPWRMDETVEPTVDYDGLIYDIEQQIITVERKAYRNPEQDAEIYMELTASMAMSGVRDDPHLYMHTPFEEELFQQRIEDQVRYGYYSDEEGWIDGIDERPNVGRCSTCGRDGVWFEDEAFMVAGWNTCEACNEEALGFFFLLALITNTATHSNKWETDWYYDMENE